MRQLKNSGSGVDSALIIIHSASDLGYLTKMVRIDLGFATHEMLGVTSSVSLIFKIH